MDLSDILSIIGIIVSGIIAILLYVIPKKNKVKEEQKRMYKRCIEDLGDLKGLKKTIERGPFIPVYAQKEAPNDDTNHLVISSQRVPLVDKLLEEIENNEQNDDKRLHYAILAGSGMGKSVFSLSFCNEYINKRYRNKKTPYSVHAFNLAGLKIDDIKEIVNKIKEPGEAILIMDSLDENEEAILNYPVFMEELDKSINKIKVVIITVRTQFFRTAKDEPNIGSIDQHSPNNTNIPWIVYYISPFTQDDAKEYFNQKYKVGEPNFGKAYELVYNKYNDWVSRPLILSYLDDITNIKDELSYVNIYREIIDKWLRREIDLYPTKKSQFDKKTQLLNLYNFTKIIAVELAHKDGFCMKKEEYDAFIKKHEIFAPYSFESRSLLNRTNNGNIKFAHKSFLEFFVAIDVLEHPERQYNPNRFDLAITFARELYNSYLDSQYNGKEEEFKKKFFYINFASSPFVISQGDEEILSPDFFDAWLKDIEFLDEMKLDDSEERKDCINNYYLSKYWNALLFKVRKHYYPRELTLYSAQDHFAIYTIDKKMIEENKQYEEIQDTSEKLKRHLGKRVEDDSTFTALESDALEDFNNRKNILYPSLESENIDNFELSCAIGNGFVENDDNAFYMVKRLCSRQSNELALKVSYTKKDKHKKEHLVSEENIHPIIILVYKEIKTDNIEEDLIGIRRTVIKQEAQYIKNLTDFLGGDIPKGKEIVIRFCSPYYTINYLIDYNSIIYSEEQIETCLINLHDAIDTETEVEKDLQSIHKQIIAKLTLEEKVKQMYDN